jgi:hypothetical protein
MSNGPNHKKSSKRDARQADAAARRVQNSLIGCDILFHVQDPSGLPPVSVRGGRQADAGRVAVPPVAPTLQRSEGKFYSWVGR